MFPRIAIIGIDCATLHGNTGLCFSTWDGSELCVTRARVCTHEKDLVESVVAELAGATRAVIALDAPLGWPALLADGLRDHRAGQPLSGARQDVFRRTTDRAIEEWSGKRPLEVGANLIARTAHAALAELDAIRTSLQVDVPLAWSAAPPDDIVAVEVYPAVTWLAHQKKWPSWFPVSDPNQYDHPLHVRDAVLCAIAAVDFIEGRAAGPGADERAMAEREGWIWAWKDALVIASAKSDA